MEKDHVTCSWTASWKDTCTWSAPHRIRWTRCTAESRSNRSVRLPRRGPRHRRAFYPPWGLSYRIPLLSACPQAADSRNNLHRTFRWPHLRPPSRAASVPCCSILMWSSNLRILWPYLQSKLPCRTCSRSLGPTAARFWGLGLGSPQNWSSATRATEVACFLYRSYILRLPLLFSVRKCPRLKVCRRCGWRRGC